MIITATNNGPRYSTDAIAHDVSRFVAARRSLDNASAPRAAATEAPATLEALYPSLFKEEAPSLRGRMAAAMGRLGRGAAALFGRRSVSLPVLALVLVVGAASTPARAAVPVWGTGVGSATDPGTAHQIAQNEALGYAEAACPTFITGAHQTNATTYFDGSQYVSTVYVSALCN